jgi:hypothetical protein
MLPLDSLTETSRLKKVLITMKQRGTAIFRLGTRVAIILRLLDWKIALMSFITVRDSSKFINLSAGKSRHQYA